MAKPLTVRSLESLKPGPVRREIPDGLTRGLAFILQPSGKASWAVRYRFHGKNKKLTLGSYPAIGLKSARELAGEALVEVGRGGDPAAAKKAAKKIARLPAGQDRIETVAEQFIARHIRAKLRPSWASEAERLMRKEIVAAWRGRALASITRADVSELLDRLADRGAGTTANRLLSVASTFCKFAISRGLIEANPCIGVGRVAREQPRDRVLNDDELRTLWLASEELGWPFGPIVPLLILTGQRLGEVAGMRWSELDLAAATWKLPKERCKNGRAHQVPLSPQAVAIFAGLPRVDDCDLVFSTTGRTPVSNFSKPKTRLEAALPDAPQWQLHDLRRSVATGMARNGTDIATIEKLLNHISGTFRGIVGVYQRHDFKDEKREALDAWGAHIERLAASGNVIALRA
jgi:integrase